MAGLGLLILSRCIYCTIVYGHGNLQAGNFSRCDYWLERDPVTGKLIRQWQELGESTESNEAPPYWLDMWLVGFTLPLVGAGIYVAEWSSRGRAHF
jgi:hypothetical protein